ncbi:hypothetical protein F2P56_012261, partial [Juglans regia]
AFKIKIHGDRKADLYKKNPLFTDKNNNNNNSHNFSNHNKTHNALYMYRLLRYSSKSSPLRTILIPKKVEQTLKHKIPIHPIRSIHPRRETIHKENDMPRERERDS